MQVRAQAAASVAHGSKGLCGRIGDDCAIGDGYGFEMGIDSGISVAVVDPDTIPKAVPTGLIPRLAGCECVDDLAGRSSIDRLVLFIPPKVGAPMSIVPAFSDEGRR